MRSAKVSSSDSLPNKNVLDVSEKAGRMTNGFRRASHSGSDQSVSSSRSVRSGEKGDMANYYGIRKTMRHLFLVDRRFSEPDLSEWHPYRHRYITGNHIHADTYMKSILPILPPVAAVFCLIFNTLLPGSGTICCGFMSICFGKQRNTSYGLPDRPTCCCVNFFIGLSQAMTVGFFLIGWIWSIIWGVYILQIALHRSELIEQESLHNLAKLVSTITRSAQERHRSVYGDIRNDNDE